MPAQTVSFAAGNGQVSVSGTGRVERVEHLARPGESYLAANSGLPQLIVGGEPVGWQRADVITDEDEVESRYVAASRSGLECTVRNAFAGSWIQRCMLVNTSAVPIQADDVITSIPPAGHMLAHAGVAAADTFWVVQPSDGLGPLLTGRLTHGPITGDAPDGLRTGPVRIQPGHRFVLQWVIDFEPDTVSFAAGLSDDSTARTDMWQHESYPVHDPDTAVLVQDPVVLDHEDGIQTLRSTRPGRYGVELRSARGSRRIDLSWVPTIDELLAWLGPQWLADDRTGVRQPDRFKRPILPDSGAALGLQYALGAHILDEPEIADDALTRHTARLLDLDRLSSHDLAYLAQETSRTGDLDPLDHAHAQLVARTEPTMGLGLAATRVCLAQLAAGSVPTSVLDRMRALSRRVVERRPVDRDASEIPDEITALELTVVSGPAALASRAQSQPQAATPDLWPDVLRLAAQLGSGLPGHRLGPASEVGRTFTAGRASGTGGASGADWPADLRGYFAAVLELMPEHVGSALRSRCSCTAGELAEQTQIAALAAALWPPDRHDDHDHQLTRLIGWLVLGRPATGET